MNARVLILMVFCLLASCTFAGPDYVVQNGKPVTPGWWGGNTPVELATPTKGELKDPQAENFMTAYRIAAYDDFFIASSHVRPGRKLSQHPPEVGYDVLPMVPDGYSPLDFSVCPSARLDEVTAGSVIIPGGCEDPTSQKPGSNKSKDKPTKNSSPPSLIFDIAATTTTTVTIKTADGQTITQVLRNDSPKKTDDVITRMGHPIPGSSYQSIRARQMALQGVALADRYCRDWFEKKGLQQAGTNLASDISSSAVSSAASIGGLVSGVAAAPAAVGLLDGLTANGATIINKDFLYGADNIGTIFDAVSQAESMDKATGLPEPDRSDWTFAQALTVIQQHQEICRTASILALIKKPIQSSTFATKKAVCPSDPSRPATRSQTVTVAKGKAGGTSMTAGGSSCDDGTAQSGTPA